MEEHTREPESESGSLDDGLPDATLENDILDKLQAHYRECKRKSVEIEAEVEFIDEDGQALDAGTAVIHNVSPTGALLCNVQVSRRSLPIGQFRVNVRMHSGAYRGIGFRCTPVRLVPEERGIGVKFDEIFVCKD